ncbi:MAG TPA: C25 family cysteine peptidase, partial [Anaerolineaceae bacterium]|nr:C25 family cysteine peptidase [Anaerolineaceae bacterium]
MKPIGKAISAILIIIFLTSSWSAPAIAASPLHSETGSASYLLFEDENTVTFQVDFPYEKMILETINSNGTNFTKISVPGWTNSNQAGHPALPVHLTQIGAPADSGFELKIIPGKTQKQKVKFPILPAETLLVDPNLPEGDADTGLPEYSINFMPDPSIYSSNQPFPSELVQVTSDGMVRQQRVIGISTFPVQFDPKTNTVIVYESIQVQVTFPETVTKMSPASSSESEIYEGLFSESLINYSTAKSWRKLDKDSIVIDSIKAFSDEISLMGEGDPWSPPNPGWRIKVKDEGFYKLTYAELQAAGLPVDTLDPRTFKVSNLGNEVAIHVEGQTDGKFDPADYILFFGEKLESKYAANNVYWITYEGTTGLRMVIQDGTPLVNDIPVNYPEHLHFEQNITYYSSTPGDNNLERFMWNYIRVPTVRPTFSHSFNLTVPESSQPYTATLRIALLGLTQVSTINPDHKVYVYLNGTQVAAPTWDGQTWNTIDIPIENAQSVLLPGNNTVLIAGTTETGVAADVIYVDWIELDFLNTYQASQNTVAFSYDLAGTWKYQVAGFTSSQVHVYDITNASAPRQITGINAISSGSAYTIQFQDTNGLDETTRYWALETSTYKTAAAIETDSPSDLISTANSADHIVITHKAFSDAAETLSNFRAAKMRAVTVDIQDVYDEFGYGIEGVMPIHNFLAYAYSHWTAPAPSYVVLMGDGNYDPKKNVAASQSTFIPPFLAFVDPSIGETAADNLFVTFSGNDNFPDMMLGRLAVNTAAEANAFVNK